MMLNRNKERVKLIFMGIFNIWAVVVIAYGINAIRLLHNETYQNMLGYSDIMQLFLYFPRMFSYMFCIPIGVILIYCIANGAKFLVAIFLIQIGITFHNIVKFISSYGLEINTVFGILYIIFTTLAIIYVCFSEKSKIYYDILREEKQVVEDW